MQNVLSQRKNFIILNGEVVVAEQRRVVGIQAVVRVWQVRVGIHVGVARVGNKEIGAGSENRAAILVVADAVRFLDDVEFSDLKVRLRR